LGQPGEVLFLGRAEVGVDAQRPDEGAGLLGAAARQGLVGLQQLGDAVAALGQGLAVALRQVGQFAQLALAQLPAEGLGLAQEDLGGLVVAALVGIVGGL